MNGKEEREYEGGEGMDFSESIQIVAGLVQQAFPLALAFAIGQKIVRSFLNMVVGGKNIDL